jgi:hypothetical protein
MRKLVMHVAALGLLAVAAPALAAAPCKDAKGRFVKCPPPAPKLAPPSATRCKDARGRFAKCPPPAPVKPRVCKDARGKFAKCGTPGARPA